jgi:hypothetical protein
MNEQLLGALIALGSAFLGAGLAFLVNHLTNKSQDKKTAKTALYLLKANLGDFMHSWKTSISKAHLWIADMKNATETTPPIPLVNTIVVNIPIELVATISQHDLTMGNDARKVMNWIDNYHRMSDIMLGREPTDFMWEPYYQKIINLDKFLVEITQKIQKYSIS